MCTRGCRMEENKPQRHPSEEQKQQWEELFKPELTRAQIDNWFINYRKRHRDDSEPTAAMSKGACKLERIESYGSDSARSSAPTPPASPRASPHGLSPHGLSESVQKLLACEWLL